MTMTCLSEDEATTRLQGLPGWRICENGIRKTYAFRSFREAIEFTQAVAEIAEAYKHIPLIEIRRNEVTITFPPQGGCGISDLDIALATHVDLAQE
jgi:4a-hydroxytetrahydrobiopterin dehydratase